MYSAIGVGVSVRSLRLARRGRRESGCYSGPGDYQQRLGAARGDGSLRSELEELNEFTAQALRRHWNVIGGRESVPPLTRQS